MNKYNKLIQALSDEYIEYSPRSYRAHKHAQDVMIDGGNHGVRLLYPFPPRIESAYGSYITDIDGHRILDFWQGHHANILGHNPEIVTKKLSEAFAENFGLQTGFTDELQIEVVDLLCQRTGSEKIRLTTSGTLATMYSVLLSRAFTGRNLVLKVGGGWHGGQPWGLKGVSYGEKGLLGYQSIESAGLSEGVTEDILVTPFNQPDALRDVFAGYGDRIACFIVEPFIGAGGLLWATKEYIQTARQLTEKYGTILVLDEVISGFRFCAGDTGSLYGIQPDLATFGKIIGGGMPVAAVGGKDCIMQLAGKKGGNKVKFSGGTFCAHPASLLASKTMLEYLTMHESEIYPKLEEMANKTRLTVEEAFLQEGILARCTGNSIDGLPGSSISTLCFPLREDAPFARPDDINNPSLYDIQLSNDVIKLAFLLEDVHIVHGLGSISTTFTDDDLRILSEAIHKVARKIKY